MCIYCIFLFVFLDDNRHFEGGANWEILAPRGNRFFLRNNIGPSWLSHTTTINLTLDCLEQIVDFKSKNPKKLWITAKPCPMLIKSSLSELFPVPEVVTNEPLTIISLYSSKSNEDGAKDFVLAAREICSRLRMHGFWGDFLNPFSGKPFFAQNRSTELYKIDERFRGLGLVVENQSECVVIKNDSDTAENELDLDLKGFRGTIFSNIFCDLKQIHELIGD